MIDVKEQAARIRERSIAQGLRGSAIPEAASTTADTYPNEDRVAAGIAYLDADWPFWWMYVDPKKLDMVSSCMCVVGQLVGEYEQVVGPETQEDDEDRTQVLTYEEAALMGFQASSGRVYQRLQAIWKQAIEARRG